MKPLIESKIFIFLNFLISLIFNENCYGLEENSYETKEKSNDYNSMDLLNKNFDTEEYFEIKSTSTTTIMILLEETSSFQISTIHENDNNQDNNYDDDKNSKINDEFIQINNLDDNKIINENLISDNLFTEDIISNLRRTTEQANINLNTNYFEKQNKIKNFKEKVIIDL